MLNLQTRLMLSDKGYSDLKKAIAACTLTNLSMMIPFAITIQIFGELLKPLLGQTIDVTKLIILFIIGILGAVLVFLASKNDYQKTYVASYLEAETTRVRVAEQIRKLPMSFFNQKNLSELTTNIMGDCATSEHVLSHIIPQLTANAISITLICLMLAVFDWRLALTVFGTVPAAFLIILITRKIQRIYGEKHVEAKLRASDQVQEYLEGIKVIKACGLQGEKFKALQEALKTMRVMSIKMEFIYGIFITGAQVIMQSGIGLTVFAGTYLLTGGQIELIPLLMFLLIIVRIYGPILTELTLLPELLYMRISSQRMRMLMTADRMEGDEIPIKAFDIAFEHISFSYDAAKKSDNTVLHDVHITLPAKSITALVGPSGSGKSTIAKLIARFWDPDAGVIRIGGVDIKTVEPEHLMSYMSFVFQDVILFNDTIYNNIKIGRMEASAEEVMAAARAASCDEFVDLMPNGYQTVLGENGGTLSGGQRQRISIARAILKDAPIVLLDEATASLDPENEVLIQQALSQLIADKTVIVIAHRLRTIAGADKIIVIADGRIVEEGTHGQLLNNHGLYAHLYRLQQESLGWSV